MRQGVRYKTENRWIYIEGGLKNEEGHQNFEGGAIEKFCGLRGGGASGHYLWGGQRGGQ